MKEKMVVRIGKNTIISLLVIGLVELPFEVETSRVRFIVMDIPEQKNLICTSIKKNERVKAHFE